MPVQTSIFESPNAIAFYLLGCFMSDGNVSFNKSGYRVSMSSKDQDFVEMIKNLIDPAATVRKETNQELYVFRKRSRVIGEWLCERGCVPNKSLILRWPTLVPRHFRRDFLRGYIDGDGSVLQFNSKGTLWGSVSICSGSEGFIDDAVAILEEEGFIFKKDVRVKAPSNYAKYGGVVSYARILNSNVRPFLEWLYYQQNLPCLSRKHLVASGLIALYEGQRTPPEWLDLRKVAGKLKAAGYSKALIAAQLGVSVAFVKKYTTGIETKPALSKHKIARQKNSVRVVDLYKNGSGIDDIIAETGFSYSAIYGYLKHVLVKIDRSDDIQKVSELRLKGMTLDQICDATGLARFFVKKHIKGMGYTQGKRTLITAEIITLLNGLFEQGLSNLQVQTSTGVKCSTVKKYKSIWRETVMKS